MVRLFVAINLPERVRDRIAAGTENLRGLEGIRWVAADRVHLTLKFLGEVDEESERSIAEALVRAVVGHAPFEARVTAPGAFPNIRRPRIIWLGLRQSPELAALQRDLEDALADLGFEREQRAFRPHLTLGRVRRGRRVDSSALDSLVRRTEVSDAWQVDAMDLMRSHLLPTGAVYDVRASARLTG
jgi:2'-5' RNA ligase